MRTTTVPDPKAGVGQKFTFFTGPLKAFKRDAADGSGQEMIIAGIASSTVRDRYGDTMSAQCQASMLEQAKNLTMFGNHAYTVPESVFGKCSSSTLEMHGDIVDLAIEMTIAQSNERAIKTWQLVHDDKVQLAFSVGGIITDAQIDEENDDGSSWWPPLIINDMDLCEISAVGVPANPRAYTRSFLEDIKKSAFKSATRDPGVQRAFLKSIGVKGVDEQFPDLQEALLTGGGVTLVKAGLEEGARIAVRCQHEPSCASFEAHESLPAEPTPCAHKDGCTEPKADDSLLCAKHRDEAPIVAPTVKTCSETDCSCAVAGDGEKCAEHTLAAVLADIEKAKQELSAIASEIVTKTAEQARLDAKLAELREQVKTLEATPTGRKTDPNPGGSSALTAKDLAQMTDAELREFARKQFAGNGGPDARTFGAAE